MSPLSQFFFKINLLIFGWAGSLLLHVGLLYLQHVGFSLQWLLGCGTQALGARASVVTVEWGSYGNLRIDGITVGV